MKSSNIITDVRMNVKSFGGIYSDGGGAQSYAARRRIGEGGKEMCDICRKTFCPSACPNHRTPEFREGVRFRYSRGAVEHGSVESGKHEGTDDGNSGRRIHGRSGM